MKTTKIDLQKLQNEEHFQFNTEFKDLVTRYDATTIDIENLFESYLTLFAQEDEALQVIRKSTITADLAVADENRDALFSGFSTAIKSALLHYNEANRTAATHIKVMLDQFGNIARESYDAETADIYKLVQALQSTYSTDITTLGLVDWVFELDAKNKVFDELMKSRYTEEASKTEYRMKQVRVAIDAAYRGIAERLDALMLVNGSDNYLPFVNELNTRVDKYKLIIAQRKGRNAKATKKSDSTTNTNQ